MSEFRQFYYNKASEVTKQSKTHEIICIVCPKGCKITGGIASDGELFTQGYDCQRGRQYAEQELVEPKRVFTGVMRVRESDVPLPVKADRPIPKKMMMRCAKFVRQRYADLPIKTGDVVIRNILNLGINIVATYDLK